jgi:alkaline phosphatase
MVVPLRSDELAALLTHRHSTIHDDTRPGATRRVENRQCESKKKNGGAGSIAEQTVDHHDVVLGGGLARFQRLITGGPHVGKTGIESAKLQGYAVVLDAAGLQATGESPLLGLFNGGNMSLEWNGPATAFPGSGFPNGQSCDENQRPADEPSLADPVKHSSVGERLRR